MNPVELFKAGLELWRPKDAARRKYEPTKWEATIDGAAKTHTNNLMGPLPPIILDSSISLTALLSGAASSQAPEYYTAWDDQNLTSWTPGNTYGAFNGTTPITLAAAPNSGTNRFVNSVMICNRDSASITLSVLVGTRYLLDSITLLSKETLTINSDGSFTIGPFVGLQSANTVYAGPTSGGAARPSFRALVIADIPLITNAKGGLGADISAGGAVGDLVQASSSSAFARLAAVATGNALISGGVGTASSWGKIGLTTHVSGTLGVGNGGTGITSYTTGDLIQASGSSTLAALAAVATGNVLLSGGVGVISSWGKVGLTTHVSGTLPVANGGTNSSTALNSNRMVYTAAGAIVEMGAMTNGQMIVGSTGNAPQIVTPSGAWTMSNAGVSTLATVAATLGGTGLTTYTQGDILYSDASNSLAKLAKGTSGQKLRIGSTIPSWGGAGNYRTVASNDSAAAGDCDGVIDCTNTITVTLGSASTLGAGYVVTIRNAGTGTITVARTSSQTIDGNNADNILYAKYSHVTLMSDGSNWVVMSAYDYVTESQTSATDCAATTVYKDLNAGVSISPGVWLASAFVEFILNGATMTACTMGVGSTSSGSGSTGLTAAVNLTNALVPTSATQSNVVIANYKLTVAATAPYYCKIQATFSAGTPRFRGTAQWLRVK